MELNPLKTLTEEKPKTRAMSAGVVGSIVESLNSVPASVVPSLLECIMTSTTLSPSSLFDSLLHALSNRMLDGEAFQLATGTGTSVISSFITALCYLLKKSGTHPTALQSFIWKACLPALELIIKNTNNHQPLLNLILQQLTDLVIQSNSWEVIHSTLLPFALCSLRLSLTMPQNINQEEAIYHWTWPWPHTTPPSLPLPLSCHIITSLLLASFTTCQHPPAPLLWDTCNMAAQMLSQTPDHRSAAIHLLLPYIFMIFTAHSSFQLSIHGKSHLLSRSSFLQKIFKCCQPLFSLGPLERRDAYAILSLYFSVFYLKENSQDIATVPEFDIRAQPEFWDEIKRGLVDKAAFVRKHSLNMLKMSFSENVGRQCFTDFSEKQMHEHSSTPLGSTRRGQWAEKEAKSLGVGQICKFADADSSGQHRWDAFVLLYEMLEEYGTHLVEAAWNHQISILLHFPCPQLPRSDVTGGVHHNQMETLEGLFSWLAVLWERGLCHENPQVRCLIMQSLLSIDWKDHGICAELVPESFIIGPFMLGLNDTVHHKEFGAKGVYSSKTMKDAKTFVSQFCKGFSLRQRLAFMHNLSSRAKEESFGRSGLMAFSACIASVGSGVEWRKVCPHDLGQLDPSEGTSSHNCKADLLDTLRHVIESSKQHFNLNYRHQVCENILEAASTVICTCDVPLETLMHFISTVPPELTHYGGALRGNMQNWVSKCSETLSCDLQSNSSMTRTHVFNSLCNFPERFVECHSPDTIVTYDDGDLEAWEFEARRWARVLLLVLMDGECLEKVFKFFQNCGSNICIQKSQWKWLPSKFLVLNLSLVQELQVMRMKSISGGIKVRSNTGSRVLESDRLFLTETSVIFEKFTFTFLFIMEELVLFAKSACSTFWCSPVMASHLPSSVSGRLGGPSQRRLASCATTAVLDAILSMKTVASLSCWCAYDGSGNSVDFTFTFLWSFSMKVILSPKCDLESETGAEKNLAAYEALVPVVDAVASSMTPMLFCLIMASDKSLLPEVKDGHWMDNLLLRFLQNINELIAVGKLARSRRAILMNWKWLCLSSLLSILCGIIQNGAHFGNNTSFFSTASLKIIYSDLVGSLEKASESSVLPMLRCVRMVLELFPMGSVGSSVLSSDGLNTEILSMKTVASLSCWCAYDGSGNSVDFTFTFLWSFSMKVILSPKCDLESETGAEKNLAAYEALVPVVDAVASSMTPMLFCLIMASDKSLLPEVKDGHWMDNLLLRFLQNINELIAVGKLARSRRAILMNWKWLCLSSLLSILCGIIQNGAHFGNNTSFFSTASLKIIYSDLVGSLEKASESSVLPMLRCVRMVLELFPMGSVGSSVLSSDGLNTEMIWELVNSSWILHVNCNKRRVAHIAALLSSALHCFIFRVDRMHETTEYTQGPCKWFVGKIIDEGTKSPRTIRLAALHLTGLWLEYPRTIRYYIEELKLLSLYGSVAFDEDFESELAESHDAKTEVSFLAKGLDIELTEAFINSELYARVSVAVLFHKLANLADKVGTIEETDNCCDAHFAGKAFLLKLLDSVVNDSDLAKELYKKNSGIHRRKVRAWQMICILSRFVGVDIVQQVTSSLHICLYKNNMPSVRQYLEIFAVQIYLKFPSLVEEQLCPIFRDYDMRPQALASYVFIAANIILHATEEVSRLRHLSELLPPITPLLTSHHHSLRGFTQLLVYKVLANVVPALNYEDSEMVPLEKKCFVDLKSYLENNSDCVRLRTSMEGFLDAFDPNTSATPAGLFTARDEEVEFECVPTSLMEQVNTFLNDVREELRGSIAKEIVIISNESITAGKDCNHLNISPKVTVESLPSQVPKDISLDFQKKISLSKPERQYGDISSISECDDFSRQFVDLEKEDELLFQLLRSRNLAMEHMRASRQDFILVASLLDRIPNIAGLARTCEVFNASCLAVSDATIVRDKQFQLISVTAEKWVPITEVPVSSMKVFLKKKQQEGFSILGLEQTANSIPLDQYAFPRKTVLVLGREKEGIPVDIIHILDACVEIPQLGVVRSLNVHVSGAIALWEYTRQHHPLQRN